MPKPNYKQTPGEKKLPLQENFQMVMDRFNRSDQYMRTRYAQKWSDNNQLYNNERTDVQYLGSSDIFIPETFTILQTIKAHILGGDPKIVFDPTRADQESDTRILSEMTDFIWQADGMDSKLDLCTDDLLAIGNSYLVQFWDPVRKLPTSEYFHAQDMFFDIAFGSYAKQRFFGYRYLTTKKALEDAVVANPNYTPGETGIEATEKRYKNLEEVEPLAAYKGDKMAKAEKEQMLLGAQFEDPDMVEVICYVDKDTDGGRMITIVNRRVAIEDVPTPFKRDKKTIESVDDMGQPAQVELPEIPAFLPFAPFRGYIDGNLWYARGEIDIIGGLQERLNDVKTQKFDNLSFLLNKMFTLDPAYADRVEEVVSAPGAVLTFPQGALTDLTHTPIGPDADIEIESIKKDMQRATAASELMQGDSTDRGMMTAEEVRAQLAQSGTRFSRKLKQMANEGLTIWAKNVFKLIQIYVDQEIAVRWVGPEGTEWKNYNPGEYLGDYEPKVMLEAEYKAQNEENKQNAMQFFLLASKMGFVDQQKLFLKTGAAIFNEDPKELEGMLLPMPGPTAPDGTPLGPGATPPELANGNGGTPPVMPGGMPAAEGMGPGSQIPMNIPGAPTA